MKLRHIAWVALVAVGVQVLALELLTASRADAGLITISGARGTASEAGGGSGGVSPSLSILAADAGNINTWVRWPEGDISTSHTAPDGGDPIVSYSYNAETYGGEILYYGHGHAGRHSRMLTFDEATDTWSSTKTGSAVPVPDPDGADTHQFSGFTSRYDTGQLFWMNGNGGDGRLYSRPAASTAWQDEGDVSTATSSSMQSTPGTAYLPGYGTPGSVVMGNQYGIVRYNVGTDAFSLPWEWSGEGHGTDPAGDPPLGDQTVAFYDPRANSDAGGVFFVDADGDTIYVYTDGTHGVKGNAPAGCCAVQDAGGDVGLVFSGYTSSFSSTSGRVRKPMFVYPGTTTQQKYNADTDTWESSLGISLPAASATTFGLVAPQYDGYVFWRDSNGTGNMQAYYYKHQTADEP